MNKNCIRIRVYCFLTALLLVKVLFCRIKNSQIWCQFWRAKYSSCECSLCMIFMDRKFVLLVLDCVKNKEPVKVIKIIFKLKIACIEFKLAWLDAARIAKRLLSIKETVGRCWSGMLTFFEVDTEKTGFWDFETLVQGRKKTFFSAKLSEPSIPKWVPSSRTYSSLTLSTKSQDPPNGIYYSSIPHIKCFQPNFIYALFLGIWTLWMLQRPQMPFKFK